MEGVMQIVKSKSFFIRHDESTSHPKEDASHTSYLSIQFAGNSSCCEYERVNNAK